MSGFPSSRRRYRIYKRTARLHTSGSRVPGAGPRFRVTVPPREGAHRLEDRSLRDAKFRNRPSQTHGLKPFEPAAPPFASTRRDPQDRSPNRLSLPRAIYRLRRFRRVSNLLGPGRKDAARPVLWRLETRLWLCDTQVQSIVYFEIGGLSWKLFVFMLMCRKIFPDSDLHCNFSVRLMKVDFRYSEIGRV